MSGSYFIKQSTMPSGFQYPGDYIKLVDSGFVDFLTWSLLDNERAEALLKNMSSKYGKTYVPFAECLGSDDVACWKIGDSVKVYIVENYTENGLEVMKYYDNIWHWLRNILTNAVDELENS
jgi:hypothetical protein